MPKTRLTEAEMAGEPLPARKRSEKRKRQALICVRLTAEELKLLGGAAQFYGLPISTYVRERALTAAHFHVGIGIGVVE